ncbi:alpha/beta fold hydrolase [Hansschlegelia zhihuaiae]|uniref:Alpha/beta hydrolase n=1 Tax=Hansschlegelia zhihuaiae TaxID=405005 RepID=A0A4Q0MJG9_9HYPH|nr:alpha/beta hydrolase [Hansschlegelia zhihuaiae]RXF73595.1 alpha/beta hydrolase [Hansschlegelia zhihuaiae]
MAPFKSLVARTGPNARAATEQRLAAASERARRLVDLVMRKPEADPAPTRTFRPAREGLVAASGVPLPDGARTRTIVTPDGVHLRCAFWRPEGAARGTVCVFQGRAEFIEKYGEVAGDLLKRGFAVAAFDFRGQGGSARLTRNPLKSHVEDFDDYRADAEAMMRQVAFASCPPPFYALSHSMSAPVLVSLALRQPQWFERIVLVAPMVGLPLDRVEFFARGLATGLGRLGFSGAYIPSGTNRVMALRPFEVNPVTSDAARYAQSRALIAQAPDLALGSPTIGWVHAAFRAMTATALPGVPESFRVPTLVLSAARDRIVDPRASDRFAARIRGGGHLMVQGSRHEIMMERDDVRELFWAAFDAFVPGTREFG